MSPGDSSGTDSCSVLFVFNFFFKTHFPYLRNTGKVILTRNQISSKVQGQNSVKGLGLHTHIVSF